MSKGKQVTKEQRDFVTEDEYTIVNEFFNNLDNGKITSKEEYTNKLNPVIEIIKKPGFNPYYLLRIYNERENKTYFQSIIFKVLHPSFPWIVNYNNLTPTLQTEDKVKIIEILLAKESFKADEKFINTFEEGNFSKNDPNDFDFTDPAMLSEGEKIANFIIRRQFNNAVGH
ncbi:MAG: hypothetical protein J0H68_02130 [Sphingobacteriia bacterium]|nr:hypothetical protein [Sphingobacteriia bacterium]